MAHSPSESTCSPTMSPPDSARARNRERIIEAALSLWLEQPDASMDDVASRAGVVRRTLYGHFRRREELMAAVALRATAFIDAPEPRLDATTNDAAIQLASMVMRLWAFGHQLRLVPLSTGMTDLGVISEARHRITTAVESIVAVGQEAGEFSRHLHPRVVASMLESIAAVLNAAAMQSDSDISAQDVALTSLMVVGIETDRAHQLLARIPSVDFGGSEIRNAPTLRPRGTYDAAGTRPN
jgi:AcrR family transcriptional regulator